MLNQVAQTGTLGSLKAPLQKMERADRCLMTFEGNEKIEIVRELGEEDYKGIFLENRDRRIKKLNQRLSMLKKFQSTSHVQDFYDNEEIDSLSQQLEYLEKEQVNEEEMLEIFQETNLKIVEYERAPKELFIPNLLLKGMIKVSQASPFRKFGRFSRISNKIQT